MADLENALLVGVNLNHDESFERSMKELGALAEACNMQVAGSVCQSMD